MSQWEKAYKDYSNGMKYKEIADKYNVSLNTVKSWAARHWKNKKVATKRQKRLQPSSNKLQLEKSAEAVVKAMVESVEGNEELTEKQKDFCVRFMQNRNATQAYLKAYGCSYDVAKSGGYENLTKPHIQAELKRLRQIKNAALGDFCGNDVVELHMRIAFADITDFVEFKSRRIPVTDSNGEIVYITHPKTDEQIMKIHVETDMIIRDSKEVDGTLLSEVSSNRDGGVKVKLADRMKSLLFLENYFELNPNDSHKKAFDDAKINIEREKIALLKERDDIEIENTDDVDGVIYG